MHYPTPKTENREDVLRRLADMVNDPACALAVRGYARACLDECARLAEKVLGDIDVHLQREGRRAA
jgi:hypothetical protein